MAKPLTRGQKAAETRKRNAAEAGNQQAARSAPAPMNASLEKVFIVFTEGLSRLERAVLQSIGDRDDAPNPAALGYAIPRITEVPQGSALGNKASSDSAPVSVMIDDVHGRSCGLRSRLETLRDALVHGAPPDAPREKGNVVDAARASQGPSKDALNWSFSNLAASEALVEEIERYLLNR